MTLAALSIGMITFDIALGMMIGANLGTAVTTFLVSFLSNTGKHRTKKIIALTHVIFNALTAIVVVLAFDPIHRFLDWTGLSTDPVMGIAAFHTLFNILGVVCWSGFISPYIRYIHRHKRDDSNDETLFAIDQVATLMPEEYISAIHKDVREFGQEVVVLLQSMTSHNNTNLLITDVYTHLKDDCEEWMSKVLRYDTISATNEQQDIIESYQLTVMEYLNAIKQLKDISLHYYYLRETNSPAIHRYMDQFDEKLMNLTEIVSSVLEHGHK
jgi:phosphate:Na+ symporter